MGHSTHPELPPKARMDLIHQTGSMDRLQHQIIVAGVLERNGRYLVIEEMVNGRRLINQPAGRLEVGEFAAEGAVRETLEESGYLFIPSAIVGVYQWYHAEQRTIYLRLAFTGELASQEGISPSDPQTLAVKWLSASELELEEDRHRSPFVLQCIRDHAAGKRYPLDLVRFFSE